MKYSVNQYAQALYEALQDTNPKSHDTVIDNFIKTLKANGDLGSYETIVNTYEQYDKQQRGVTEVEITTTTETTINKTLLNELNKLVGKNAEVIQKKMIE
jgi:F0F1-type ATP synthase delta subunit